MAIEEVRCHHSILGSSDSGTRNSLKHGSVTDTQQEFSIEIPDKEADAIHSGM